MWLAVAGCINQPQTKFRDQLTEARQKLPHIIACFRLRRFASRREHNEFHHLVLNVVLRLCLRAAYRPAEGDGDEPSDGK